MVQIDASVRHSGFRSDSVTGANNDFDPAEGGDCGVQAVYITRWIGGTTEEIPEVYVAASDSGIITFRDR